MTRSSVQFWRKASDTPFLPVQQLLDPHFSRTTVTNEHLRLTSPMALSLDNRVVLFVHTFAFDMDVYGSQVDMRTSVWLWLIADAEVVFFHISEFGPYAFED